MKFIIHPQIQTDAQRGIAWAKAFLNPFDTSKVAWLRIDFGREYKDRNGRPWRRYLGVYGRCWYPSRSQPSFRLSCQVPGPFPCDIVTRQKPVYRSPDGSWPEGFDPRNRQHVHDLRSGRYWARVYGKTVVQNLDEAIVWIVAHESFHWLRRTGQIPGRNIEAQADEFADRKLEAFRQDHPLAASGAIVT